MRSNQRGSTVVQFVWTVAGLVLIVAAILSMKATWPSNVKFTTPYQAVLLTNGSAYFGKLTEIGRAETDIWSANWFGN